MLLAIDVGNTQTHFGVFDGTEMGESWRFSTDSAATADQLAVRVSSLLRLREIELKTIDAMIVSSVVPTLSPEYEGMCERYLDRPCITVGPNVKTGMPILMDNPRELGADRLVNAIAAYDRYQRACVVVDFGTAITFDAVSEAGEYLGGIITPGIEISMEALASRAAKLPRIDLTRPETLIGKTTQASIQSGIVYGFAGQVDGISARLRAELGPDTPIIATGGHSRAISPFCEGITDVDDLLTLTGLRLIYERSR